MCEQNLEFNEEIKQIVERCGTSYYKPLVKNPKNKHLYNYIMEWTSFLEEDVKLAVRIYLTLTGKKELVKCANPNCGNDLPDRLYLPLKGPYQRHCCSKCAGKDPLTLERRVSSCIDKYGVPNISNVKSIKTKAAQTFKNRPEKEKKKSLQHSRKVRLERYGSFNNGQKISESMKNRTIEQKKSSNAKRAATNLSTYGVVCTCGTDKANENRRRTIWSKTYDRFIKDNEEFEALFTRDYFCKHGNEMLRWKCKKCGHVFEARCWDHSTQNLYKIARCLKCQPLNCRESKTENEVCKFIKSICDEPVLQTLKKIIKPYELDMYMPSRDFAIEFNGIYWHSIECSTPAIYHKEKTDLCESKGMFLLHVFDAEWKYRRALVENHIRIILDYGIEHCVSEYICHTSKNELHEFLKQNAVAYREPTSNGLAIKSNGQTVFMAEVETADNSMTVKQFCFKTGFYADDALQMILDYACRLEHVFVNRDRRMWPRSMFDNFNIRHVNELDIQKMVISRKHFNRMTYEDINDEILYTMYDSGIEILEIMR